MSTARSNILACSVLLAACGSPAASNSSLAPGVPTSTAIGAPAVAAPAVTSAPTRPAAAAAPPTQTIVNGVEHVEGEKLDLLFEGKKCIHARFCVTGAPSVFLANVEGPWIHPDAMDAERLVDIAHACPSGAIRYERKDGRPDETPAPVNLIAIR